jgi:hypothetical protein
MNFSEKEQKNLLYGAVALGAVALIYQATKTDGTSDIVDPTGNGIGGNYGNYGQTAPAAVFSAEKVAEKLYDAMKSYGTDENKILSALKSVNQAQFGLVVKAFKKRTYNPITGNQYTVPFVPLTAYPLDVWLYHELDDDVYETLRTKYPNYL